MERKPPLERIILSLILTMLIFLSGFEVSYLIFKGESNNIKLMQNEFETNLISINLERELMDCNNLKYDDFSKELYEMSSVLGVLEKKFGKKDPQVIQMKKIYTIIEVQHYLLTKKYSKECNSSIPIILFFYSNNKEFLKQGEKIGYMLSYLRKESEKKIIIYSFDYDLDTNLIKILKKKFNIEKPNIIIINNTKLYSPKNINEIKPYFK